MAENTFRKTEKSISDVDLDAFESFLGSTLPADFRTHYLKYNGGVPARVWWDSLDEHAPCMVTEFKSINTGKHNIATFTQKLRDKGVLPPHFLPFAGGESGSCFCLDLQNGTVLHYTPDKFDAERSLEDNVKRAQRKLSRSLNEFVKGLVTEKELDNDF